MKRFLSERNFVILLFVATLLMFSVAQEDCRAMEDFYNKSANTEAKPAIPIALGQFHTDSLNK